MLGKVHILRNPRGEREVSKIFTHEYGGGGGGGGWPYDDISQNIFFFLQNEIVLKQKTINNKAYIVFFISGVSVIYINMNNC